MPSFALCVGGGGPAHPQYANYWAPLTRKRHTMPHSAQPRQTNYWAPRTRKRHQQEHRPQRPSERSDRTQRAKGRTGDCPGPRKETTTRRNGTQGGVRHDAWMDGRLQWAVPPSRLATYPWPFLEPSPSAGGSAHQPPPRALPLPVYPVLTSPTPHSFPSGGCANRAPRLSLLHCSVPGPHGGGPRPLPSPLAGGGGGDALACPCSRGPGGGGVRCWVCPCFFGGGGHALACHLAGAC